MTILSVVKDVCAVVGVIVPGSVFANLNSNRTMQEMLACANEMAQRIAGDTREWTKLKKQTDPLAYVGDGATTSFNIPADYKRMLLTGNVWLSSNTRQPARFIADTDEWLQRRASNDYDSHGEWTLLGSQIHIWPAMGAGVSARFAYLDRNCIALASGGFGDRFMADTDSYRLDERLLTLGMIWDWKAKKGSPYAEDMGSWSDALAIAFGSDKPAPILIDRVPLSSMARVAYPWQLPT